jgi:hypothetical protein
MSQAITADDKVKCRAFCGDIWTRFEEDEGLLECKLLQFRGLLVHQTLCRWSLSSVDTLRIMFTTTLTHSSSRIKGQDYCSKCDGYNRHVAEGITREYHWW